MSIDLARRIGRALNVRSHTRIRAIDQALEAYARLTAQSPTVPFAGTIAANQVTSGTFANARIAQSNVTQHEAALQIDWIQIVNEPATFPPSAHNHAASEVTSGTFSDARIAQSNVTQHQAALSLAATQLVSGVLANARVQQSNVTQHEAALDIDWTQLLSIPSTFTPADHIISGSWTPADASGAGLSFSLAEGSYSKHEKVVIARCLVIFPATANGADIVVSGLPFTSANTNATRQGFVSYTDKGAHIYALPDSNSQTFKLYDAAGAAVINSAMSGKRFFATLLYVTA